MGTSCANEPRWRVLMMQSMSCIRMRACRTLARPVCGAWDLVSLLTASQRTTSQPSSRGEAQNAHHAAVMPLQ